MKTHKKFLALSLSLLIYLSAFGCASTTNESLISDEIVAEYDMQLTIQNKATDIDGDVLEYEIDESNNALAVILHDDISYDYWYFTADSEKLILTTQLHMSHCVKHIENGETFLIVYETIMGGAFPANIVTLVNGKPVVVSEYTDGDDFPTLYYENDADIICVRGNGISSGTVNVIPYYWNNETSIFEAYSLQEISMDELKEMDSENVVEDIDNIISVYQRNNGLVHVNYADINEANINSSTIASRTYVITESNLRKYDFETDRHYGFFINYLSVSE